MRDHEHVAAPRRTDRIAGLGKKTHQTGLDRVESLSAARGIRVRDDVGHLGQPTVVLLERQRPAETGIEHGMQEFSRLALQLSIAPFAQTRIGYGRKPRSGRLAPNPGASFKQRRRRLHGPTAVA